MGVNGFGGKGDDHREDVVRRLHKLFLIQETSAGLYICFFALFIIVFVLVTFVTPPKETAAKAQGRARRLTSVFWELLFALAACGLGLAFLPEGFRSFAGIAMGVLSVSLSSVVVALIRIAYEDST